RHKNKSETRIVRNLICGSQLFAAYELGRPLSFCSEAGLYHYNPLLERIWRMSTINIDSPRGNARLEIFGGDRVVSAKQTADLLGVSYETLRRMWSRGEGPRRIQISPRRMGTRLSDILAFLESRAAA